MHVRRILLLVAMVLLLTAGVIAIAPPRHDKAGTAAGLPPAVAGRGTPPRAVDLRYPPPKRLPVTRLVPGDHVLVQVTTTQPGEAALMSLTDTAEPDTPATFDVLMPGAARYAVTFTPEFGRAQKIATLQVEP